MGGVFSIFGITIAKENVDKCLIYLFKSCFVSGIATGGTNNTKSTHIVIFVDCILECNYVC